MGRRKDPASAVIEYFETAPPEAAVAVLGVVKSIVARRLGPKAKTARATRQGTGATTPTNDAAKP